MDGETGKGGRARFLRDRMLRQGRVGNKVVLEERMEGW